MEKEKQDKLIRLMQNMFRASFNKNVIIFGKLITGTYFMAFTASASPMQLCDAKTLSNPLFPFIAFDLAAECIGVRLKFIVNVDRQTNVIRMYSPIRVSLDPLSPITISNDDLDVLISEARQEDYITLTKTIVDDNQRIYHFATANYNEYRQ